ncbi:MAG: hypothetical protein ACK56F_07210, partial [bacterium]
MDFHLLTELVSRTLYALCIPILLFFQHLRRDRGLLADPFLDVLIVVLLLCRDDLTGLHQREQQQPFSELSSSLHS